MSHPETNLSDRIADRRMPGCHGFHSFALEGIFMTTNNRRRIFRVSTFSVLAFALGMLGGSAHAQKLANRFVEPGTNLVLQFNLIMPAGHNPAMKYPLLVCLHAAGSPIPRTLGMGCYEGPISNNAGPSNPSFYMVPISQTDASGWGDPIGPISDPQKFEGRLTVVAIKDLFIKYPSIDQDRIYVTGPSMGARGTWDLIRRNPDFFAAAAPMAGPALAADAALYVNQNIWAVNGENDTGGNVVALNRSAIAAIRALGGNPIYSELAGHGHDSWRTIYPLPAFAQWIFKQKRGVPWTMSGAGTPSLPGIALTPGQALVVTPTGGSGGRSGGGTGGSGTAGIGGSAGQTGSGGAAQPGTGGTAQPGTGGTLGTGGVLGTGGLSPASTGGSSSTGGTTATPGTGGVPAATTGGQIGTTPGTGGAAGGPSDDPGASGGGGCSHATGRPVSGFLGITLLGLLTLLLRRGRSRRHR
ncbi:MAG: hypothetical protein ABUS79_01790 [Pseudomonadota bacterium]